EKMSGGKPARAADWAAIRRDYETCRDSLCKVAERCGVPESTIYDRRKREGWQRQGPGVDWKKVRAEYENGEFPVADVGERHGVSQYTLYRRKRAEGWKARQANYPKARGGDGAVNAGERLKSLVARELSSIEARMGLKDKLDAGDPLRALHTLASAIQKILDIERKEKAADDAGKAGRLTIDDASRLALAQRLETLARHWENAGDSGGT
ncbi:MAG: hypothetical protein ACREDU_07505, partial [Methylocella sp.]